MTSRTLGSLALAPKGQAGVHSAHSACSEFQRAAVTRHVFGGNRIVDHGFRRNPPDGERLSNSWQRNRAAGRSPGHGLARQFCTMIRYCWQVKHGRFRRRARNSFKRIHRRSDRASAVSAAAVASLKAAVGAAACSARWQVRGYVDVVGPSRPLTGHTAPGEQASSRESAPTVQRRDQRPGLKVALGQVGAHCSAGSSVARHREALGAAMDREGRRPQRRVGTSRVRMPCEEGDGIQ